MPYNAELFQNKLVTYSSPTLMRMKVGSLFCIRKEEFPNYDECLSFFNGLLGTLGLKICTLKLCHNHLLIYVYHQDKLERLLTDDAVASFLASFHYEFNSIDEALMTLRNRLQKASFPHEIGVFLGYPLFDIHYFMTRSLTYKCVGCWKVYGNEKNALKKFYRYECVKNDLNRRLSNGQSILEAVKT